MPSLALTLLGSALASLTLAAPTARQLTNPPDSFYIRATSIYTSGKYTDQPLNGCHTAAGQEAFCAYNSTPGGVFALNTTTSNLVYYLTINGGSEQLAQPLSFIQNSSYPTLEYGFFGTNGETKQFEIDENEVIGVVQEGTSSPLTTFYLCPEYVDYDHEGYPTVSLIGEYDAVPADSGCDAVTLKKTLV